MTVQDASTAGLRHKRPLVAQMPVIGPKGPPNRAVKTSGEAGKLSNPVKTG